MAVDGGKNVIDIHGNGIDELDADSIRIEDSLSRLIAG